MIYASVLTSLEEMAEQREPVLLLYSGGLDGTYLLRWAADQGVDIQAVHVLLDDTDAEAARRGAKAFGIPLTVYDGRDEFANDFIRPAIRQNAWYQGLYPVSSTLTRPLMARVAVNLAHRLGIRTIAHTSTYMQNTAMRFASSILALDPSLTIAAPFTSSTVTRPEKAAALAEHSELVGPQAKYSVDANVWARVIENDTLEDPELLIPESKIFAWTVDPSAVTSSPKEITITFEGGSPTALDGEQVTLLNLVDILNRVAGEYGIGRFSGLESISGVELKNHEVREAPAAAVLTVAHHSLEVAVLTDDELSTKAFLDNKATSLEVGGGWFGDLATACRSASDILSTNIRGDVTVRLHPGVAQVVMTRSANGLYYSRFGRGFSSLMSERSVASQVSLTTLPARLRATSHREGGADAPL